MRAMRINTKKKECVNAPIGSFTMFSHCECDYNIRNELVCSRRDEMHRRSSASEGRFGVAEPEGCASICEGAEVLEYQYQYDDIGDVNSITPNSTTPSLISKSGPLADFFRHRFSTKYFDAETGLYYYGYRFYSPELMRWITRDPIGEEGGVNLYAFCENGSTFLIDATGLTKYWDKYMNFKDYTSGHVWKQVGGNLYWGYLSGIYYDSCALRVSRTLILNGHSPKQGKQRNVNRDYVILKEIVSPDGVVIPKGKKLKAESNGKRYVISAHAIRWFSLRRMSHRSYSKEAEMAVGRRGEKTPRLYRKRGWGGFFCSEWACGNDQERLYRLQFPL